MDDFNDIRGSAKKSQGWEEAGGEFYHESYAACDWEAISKNNIAITLLPSKKNRFETYKRTQNATQTHKKKRRQSTATTTLRGEKQQEVQFSVLPDFSEALTDERCVWEQMLQIKLLPVSMQQKKELKSKLQSATRLRLQGFNNFKWQHRKAWEKITLKWSEIWTKLQLWHSSLKQLEGHFGTGVVSYFLLLRWLLMLNGLTCMLIALFIILPNVLEQYYFNASTADEQLVQDYSEETVGSLGDSLQQLNILDIFQGTGQLKTSLMFYGAYSSNIIGRQHNATEAGGVNAYLQYNLRLAYLFVILCNFIITLTAIVRAAAREFKDRLIYGKWQFYRYCNLIFCGWDFCIHNEKTAIIKQKSLYIESKCLLQSKRMAHERNSRSKQTMCRLVLIRFLINLLVITLLLISAFLIYLVFDISLKHQSSNSFYAKDEMQQQAVAVNSTHFEQSTQTQSDENQVFVFFMEFAPFLLIVCLNLFLPAIFQYLCEFEKYSPLFEIKISLLRTVFLRLASLGIILSRFYFLVLPKTQAPQLRPHSCWETFVGQQFYKLALTDFASHLFVTFCVNFPRAFCARAIKHNFMRIVGEQEFELSKHVLDIVYSQTVCWLGTFYAPILPLLMTIFTFFMFYIKKFQCLINSKPSKMFYGASKSNSLFMITLLLSFFVALVPITYAIAEVSPSLICGPFRGLHSVWDAAVNAFLALPTSLKDIVFFFGTASFAIPCFVLLILLLYYFYAVSDANKNMVDVLKTQLVLEGHDKQFLLHRLSVFLKKQEDNTSN